MNEVGSDGVAVAVGVTGKVRWGELDVPCPHCLEIAFMVPAPPEMIGAHGANLVMVVACPKCHRPFQFRMSDYEVREGQPLPFGPGVQVWPPAA